MKALTFTVCIFFAISCMKSKEEYRQAIDEIQREEEAPGNPERSRGSNDAEGMGMDE
jgi:hypothetical protein